MKLIDTHSHYDDEKYNSDRGEVIENNLKSGVDYIVNIGCDISSSKKSIELSSQYKEVYATIGIHPYSANRTVKKDMKILENMLKRELQKEHKCKVVAIGEIGLDYHYEKSDEIKQNQKVYFLEQLELADRYNLPSIIHSREATEDMVNILKEKNIAPDKLLFHCFDTTHALASLVLEKGYMVAFGGNVTYKRNKKSLDIIKEIPIKQIVLETDCPYLSPEPVRGSRNESKNIQYILKKLSQIKEITMEELEKEVYSNSKRFFGIK